MTSSEKHWLAGILEGEGCFVLATSRARGRLYYHPRIDLAMSDEDVVLRAAVLLGSSYRAMPRKLAYKVMWKTSLYASKAAAMMKVLYPLLGERRRKQIDHVIKEWERTRAQPWGKRNAGFITWAEAKVKHAAERDTVGR